MTAATIKKYFYDACLPIKYPCQVDDHYIDPCSCTSFYRCVNVDSILRSACAAGTGFDFTAQTCVLLTDLVYDGKCDDEKPWKRCSDSDIVDYDDVDESALQRRCTNMTGPATPAPTSDGVDGGLIAGVVIAVLLILIIAAVLVVYVRKKGNPVQHMKQSRVWRSMTHKEGSGQASSQPSAPWASGNEETYAEIEDTAVYRDTSGGPHLAHSLSHTNETYDKDDVEVSYDNPAFQPDIALPSDRAVHPLPPEYSALEEQGQTARSYSSLSQQGAAPVSSRTSKELPTGDDGYLVAEAIGQSVHQSDSEEPNYFVLEKS
ncbi:uncharacterized protein LOC143299426 [Babylonia areolata]|uniref:uncharacterized protein LOC143299426 n=1 Tax=Babylonia areolata TaxID=304850 RepID=UPI003FD058F0